jgi:2-(1,2-epoxy-1,2-dihydrophenyl)acetyl-CoA isomerase
LLREERTGSTAILTLDYPERRNALAMAMRRELIDAIETIEADRDIHAVVVTGAAENFSAGGDISGMDATDLAAGRERFRVSHRLVRLIVESSKPFIAAVEGWAVGAGFGLALCCDTVVAADNARFMAGFGKIGLIADFALLHTLPRRIGEGRARQFFLYNEPMTAEAAERIGLIDHVVPAGTALDAAMQRAAVLADAAPLPIAMTKSFFARGLADALELERNTQSTMFLTADHAEGKQAFLQKRPPKFRGL